MWRKKNPSALLVGMQIAATTVESSMEIHQKIKNGSVFGPVILLLGLYPKEPRTLIQKNISIPMFKITKIWKQIECQSVDK